MITLRERARRLREAAEATDRVRYWLIGLMQRSPCPEMRKMADKMEDELLPVSDLLNVTADALAPWGPYTAEQVRAGLTVPAVRP